MSLPTQNLSGRKVDTIRAFQGIYGSMKFQGMFITEDNHLRYRIFALINYFLVNICYYSSFIIELFFVKDLRQLLENLPMNICLIACSLKFFVILRLRPSLIDINKQLKCLDEKSMTDKQKEQLEEVINVCRLLSMCVITLYLTVNLAYGIAGAASHGTRLGHETWFPYDWRNNSFRFWVSLTIQTTCQLQLGLEQVVCDLMGAVYLCVLSVHLKIILERFANIHYDPKETEEESMQQFIQCVEDHHIVMGIFDVIQNSISHIILFQFLASIFAFSTSGLAYLRFPCTLTETAAIAILMIAEVIEIYPSCYYASKFSAVTDQTVFILYSLNWMDFSPKFRKNIITFMQMTQEMKIILAGNQVPITLATFMSVMKAMYTMLMIMKPDRV